MIDFLVALLIGAQATVDAPKLQPPPTQISASTGVVVQVIPALTDVDVEILANISSKTAQIGETFPIRLVKPITADGVEIVPAGTTGVGEIVHAAKARAAGKAGELILAARYLDVGGARLPLRSLRLAGKGNDHTDIAFAVGVAAGFAAYLVVGGEIDIPGGTYAGAKTAAPFPAPPPPSIAALNP